MIKHLLSNLSYIGALFGLTSYERSVLKHIRHKSEDLGERTGLSNLHSKYPHISKKKIEQAINFLLKKKLILLHENGGFYPNKEVRE